MQNGENYFKSWLLLNRVDINGNSSTVINDAKRSIFHQRYGNLCAIACERLIYCVIDDFIDEVVKAALTCGADIHTWALADCLKTLKDGDRGGVISAGFLLHISQGGSFKSPVWGCRAVIPQQQAEILSLNRKSNNPEKP
ncbi:unannotated protein [freshwater metagenome]|uniref:Unannotated protein n=1 Tax=freshwater metagenome TaxID=449393 RepID=A0A6J6I461_9ZZZZ